jgi:hypothetical protein
MTYKTQHLNNFYSWLRSLDSGLKLQNEPNLPLLNWVISIFYKLSAITYELVLQNKAIFTSVLSVQLCGKKTKQTQISAFPTQKQGLQKNKPKIAAQRRSRFYIGTNPILTIA